MTNKTKYTHRAIARVIIEAASPIAIGTGEKNILTDSPVATDIYGLPYIPGSSLAGVLRHALGYSDENNAQNPFGYQDSKGGHGSYLIFSDAVMIGKDGKAMDGLMDELKNDIDWDNDFYKALRELPIRQHANLNDFGTVSDTGKFDNAVALKGTRFVFEVEMPFGDEGTPSFDDFKDMLRKLSSKTLRIGSGAHNGLGELEVIKCQCVNLDLSQPDDLEAYLNKSSKLSVNDPFIKDAKDFKETDDTNTQAMHYELTLHPDSFFLFGSGVGDDEADMTPATENIIIWDANDKPSIKEERQLLIPATSIKGAIAHRTAYHYNRLTKRFAETKTGKTGDENEAVSAIFGRGGDKPEEIKAGKIFMSDLLEEKPEETVLNHVAIDRFTGGAIDGALFQEKVSVGIGKKYTIHIYLPEKVSDEDNDKIIEAFEAALKDICRGLLPLGGGVNRGNGMFTGTLTKNDKEIYSYE